MAETEKGGSGSAAMSSGEGKDNYGTPAWLFDAADAVLGPFDLDAAAEPWSTKCARFITKEQDALDPAKPWAAKRVWLNPPHSRGMIERFLAEVRRRIDSGDIAELAAVLLPGQVSDGWWHAEARHASEIRTIRGRLKYVDPETGVAHKNTPTVGAVLLVYRPEGKLRVTTPTLVFWNPTRPMRRRRRS